MEMALLYDGVLLFAESCKSIEYFPIQLDCSNSVWDKGSTYKNYLALLNNTRKYIELCESSPKASNMITNAARYWDMLKTSMSLKGQNLMLRTISSKSKEL
uniref:Uncharacterized protein n=1 Tax=Megaselia scalaris TaxID=36166 RepID=T1GVY8_MEGSC